MKGVNKRGLDISKREVKGVRMTSDLCTNEDQWKRGVGMNVDLVVDVGLERSNEEGRVVIKLVEVGDEPKEVCGLVPPGVPRSSLHVRRLPSIGGGACQQCLSRVGE